MKKLFPDENDSKKGFKEFLDKKGFYVVLLLCIAVVAGTAVYVTTRNADPEQLDYEARNIIPEAEDDDLAIEDPDLVSGADLEDTQASAAAGKQSDIGDSVSITNSGDAEAAKPTNDKNTDDKNKTDTPKESTTPAKTTTPKSSGSNKKTQTEQQSFKMPVTGEISLEFAKDKLVYSKTLEEWRAHMGVDIAADRGTPVKAVADGVVDDVRNDPYYGIIVVIDHGNDLKSLYRNLASDEVVIVNQKVKQGEVIGSIGNTAIDESAERPHLHFEVLKKDVHVDPMTYLP